MIESIMIEEFIPAGYKNRITRSGLQDITHMTDRKIREQIAEAGDRGVLIASYDGGYFQRESADDDPYIEAYIAQEKSRLNAQRHKMKMLRRAWAEINDDQMNLF